MTASGPVVCGQRDPGCDAQDGELERRLATLQVQEAVIAEHVKVVRTILAAADARDAQADARDLAAEKRDHDLDQAEFLDADAEYGSRWPERRGAALDRQHAREDRLAARRDRTTLARAMLRIRHGS
jgi:hypothetical protein